MESNLKMNAKLTQLLKNVAQQRGITLSALKEEIDENEILDRFTAYPKLSVILLPDNIDIDSLRVIANDLLVFARWDKSQFKAFLKNTDFAKNAIQSLIKDFPKDDTSAAKRIDAFIENLITSDLSKGKDGLKESQVALFCSLFLTVAFPERFVDFRQNRWMNLARRLGYELPDSKDTHGQKIVWAGKFAQVIAKTAIFQKYWHTEYPLWAVAGLCWNLKNEKVIDIIDTEYDDRIQSLLNKKGQVILYGPPGTGKTYHARQVLYRKEYDHYTLEEKSLLDQRVFSITIWPPRDGEVFDLNPGDEFLYQWKGRRNWQKHYDELREGDVLLAYHPSPFKQYRAILRCLEKEENSIRLEYLRSWDGPTFNKMKEDPVLQETLMMRVVMTFSLKRLDEVEFERIQALSHDLTSEALGLVVTRILETIPISEFVTFHPSFGYEEFIEGLRPESDEEGVLCFSVQEGIFKKFARQACNILLQESGIEKRWMLGGGVPQLNKEEKDRVRNTAPDVPFYLVIDEINRGDISRIFGELITLLEADKRYAGEHEIITKLPYSKQSFAIPPNLFLLGTMNTADKSIALVDIALRRRFGFIEMMPDCNLLRRLFEDVPDEVQPIADLAVSLLENLNSRILKRYDRDHQIGHSYFIGLKETRSYDEAVETLRLAWYYEVIPLLQEYFYDSPGKLKEVIGDLFVSVDGDYGFSFMPERSGGEFINAMKAVAKERADIPNGASDADSNII